MIHIRFQILFDLFSFKLSKIILLRFIMRWNLCPYMNYSFYWLWRRLAILNYYLILLDYFLFLSIILSKILTIYCSTRNRKSTFVCWRLAGILISLQRICRVYNDLIGISRWYLNVIANIILIKQLRCSCSNIVVYLNKFHLCMRHCTWAFGFIIILRSLWLFFNSTFSHTIYIWLLIWLIATKWLYELIMSSSSSWTLIHWDILLWY